MFDWLIKMFRRDPGPSTSVDYSAYNFIEGTSDKIPSFDSIEAEGKRRAKERFGPTKKPHERYTGDSFRIANNAPRGDDWATNIGNPMNPLSPFWAGNIDNVNLYTAPATDPVPVPDDVTPHCEPSPVHETVSTYNHSSDSFTPSDSGSSSSYDSGSSSCDSGSSGGGSD